MKRQWFVGWHSQRALGKTIPLRNTKASWRKVRSYCNEAGYTSYADCKAQPDPNACPKVHNVMATLFGLAFNSDRGACVATFKERGPDQYAAFMASHRPQSLPRRGPKPV